MICLDMIAEFRLINACRDQNSDCKKRRASLFTRQMHTKDTIGYET